jgi:fucose permease
MATALFLAYALMSIPSGILVDRFSPKTMMVLAFTASTIGAFWLAVSPSYTTAIPALFLIGIGFAMLQVVINPLLRVAGGEENYAFFGNMAQLIFAFGSVISPHLYGFLVAGINQKGPSENWLIGTLKKIVPEGQAWASLYWVFAFLLALMVIVVLLAKTPKMTLKEEEKVGSMTSISTLLKSRLVWLYFIGIFCYVGTEQGISVWLKPFLTRNHGVSDPLADNAVSFFWLAMLIGCALSLVLLRFFDSRRILTIFFIGGMLTLLVSLMGPASVAVIALPLMGFWCSVGWPLIFSLALNSVSLHHGAFAGILCTGILGGALLPPLIGWLSDLFSLKIGMLFILLPMTYVLSIGVWAKPLINNLPIRNES